MNQKIIIESLAMDLKRVATGLQRGSTAMANRFKEEAFKRSSELKAQKKSAHLEKLLSIMNNRLMSTGDGVAEDSLMLSTLFQNYALKSKI